MENTEDERERERERTKERPSVSDSMMLIVNSGLGRMNSHIYLSIYLIAYQVFRYRWHDDIMDPSGSSKQYENRNRVRKTARGKRKEKKSEVRCLRKMNDCGIKRDRNKEGGHG